MKTFVLSVFAALAALALLVMMSFIVERVNTVDFLQSNPDVIVGGR